MQKRDFWALSYVLRAVCIGEASREVLPDEMNPYRGRSAVLGAVYLAIGECVYANRHLGVYSSME